MSAGPAPLRRGINLTNWFRFPPSRARAALAAYLSDAGIANLRAVGFDFARLAVAPDMVLGEGACPDLVVAAIRRLQARGLAVVVGLHPTAWRLESQPADRAALLAFWARLAPMLRPLDPALTVPEVLNEPVFAGQPAAWAALQRATLATIRANLPEPRVLLTGGDWGGIGGLLALEPVDDPRALYSVHFYDPVELTSLAAYRPGLDRAALARLPFPMTQAACASALQTPDRATGDLIRFVCAMRWDAAAVDARIGAAASWGARHRVPVLLGEFGATAALNRPARLAWIGAVRESCERHGIGWALWGYDDVMGFAQHPAAMAGTPALDGGLLSALGLGMNGASRETERAFKNNARNVRSP